MKRSTLRLLVCTLGLSAALAHATAVNQTFTLMPDFGGALAGPVSGRFSFDDEQPPTATGHGDRHRSLTAFELRLGGVDFTLGDLGDAFAVFDGDRFVGLEVTIDGRLTLSPSADGQDPFFAYVEDRQSAMGAVTFGNGVPEPGTLAAALAAIAALAAARPIRRHPTA